MAKQAVPRIIRDIIALFQKQVGRIDLTNHGPATTPQQTNGFDCGVFTCILARAILRGEAPMTVRALDMPYWRAHVAVSVLHFLQGGGQP